MEMLCKGSVENGKKGKDENQLTVGSEEFGVRRIEVLGFRKKQNE